MDVVGLGAACGYDCVFDVWVVFYLVGEYLVYVFVYCLV